MDKFQHYGWYPIARVKLLQGAKVKNVALLLIAALSSD